MFVSVFRRVSRSITKRMFSQSVEPLSWRCVNIWQSSSTKDEAVV